MVKLSATILAVLSMLFLVACGGGGNSTSTAVRSQPTPRPTAKPSTGGPTASVDPKSGPAGTQVTVKGTGFPANADVLIIGDVSGPAGDPYAHITAGSDGSFSTSFVLSKLPSGADLKVGPYGLIARVGSTNVPMAFQVERLNAVPGGNIPGGG